MDINAIIDTTKRTSDAIISDLKQKTIAVPSWSRLLSEYDARLHPVMDKKLYKDKPRKDGTIERVTRITLPLQRLAVKRMSELLFGIPVKRVYKPETDDEQRAAKIIEGIFERNRIDSVNIERGRALYASCECATIWYAQEQEAIYGGEASPIKVRCKTFSPMNGAQLYPLFDEYEDLQALSIEYTREEATRTIRYFEAFTKDRHIRWSNEAKDSDMLIEVDEAVSLNKITGVYIHRTEPIWEDQSENVFEAEWTLSRNGNYIRKNARPNWVVFSNQKVNYGKESGGDNEGRNVLQYPADAKAEYVTWQQATDSLKYHVDEIKRNFFMTLQLPDMSMDTMKATPMSGEARKMLFIDAQMKAGDEAGIWYELLDREVNVVRAFVAAIFPELSEAVHSLAIETIITPFNIRDEQERIANLTNATGGLAIMSQRTAVANLGYVDDIDRELEEINENAANGMEDIFKTSAE